MIAFVNFEDDNIVIPFVWHKVSRTAQTDLLFSVQRDRHCVIRQREIFMRQVLAVHYQKLTSIAFLTPASSVSGSALCNRDFRLLRLSDSPSHLAPIPVRYLQQSTELLD